MLHIASLAHSRTHTHTVTIDKLFNFALDACFRGGASSLINSIINSNFRHLPSVEIYYTWDLCTDIQTLFIWYVVSITWQFAIIKFVEIKTSYQKNYQFCSLFATISALYIELHTQTWIKPHAMQCNNVSTAAAKNYYNIKLSEWVSVRTPSVCRTLNWIVDQIN